VRGDGIGDIVEVLEGIGATLMVISARLDDIVRLLRGEEDGEADA
jgi:hypothetical protein